MKNRLTRTAGLLLLLAALLIGLSVLFHSRLPAPAARKPGKAAVVKNTGLLDNFDSWLDDFSNAQPSERTAGLEKGLELARARRAVMERLIQDDPKEALAHAVPLDVWKKLPPALQAEVEEPFSAIGEFRVLPVCVTGTPDAEKVSAGRKFPDAVRYTKIDGQPALNTFVFGRRSGLGTKEKTPLQGIRLGGLAALHEEVFHELTPAEAAVATTIYPLANPLADRDFSTGEILGNEAVTALSGGGIFHFRDKESLQSFDASIAALDAKPGPRTGAAVLFLPFPAAGSVGAFNLPAAVKQNNNLASAWTETKKKLFMIRCDFSDKPSTSFSVVSAGTYGTMLNTTVSDDLRNFSYGKTWIEATVSAAVIRLPQTSAYYAALDAFATSRNYDLLADAKAAYLAANSSFNEFDYDIVGIWFVSTGMASGGVTYAGLAGGRDLWIQGTTDTAVHVHELGHNYGIGHSSFWIPPVNSTNPVDPAGTYEEYGDPFDVMGGGPVPEGVYHSEAKQRLNWLSTGQWADATAGGSGTYRIYRIDHPDTSGIRGLRVTKSTNEHYWLSYRRLFQNAWLKAGANIVWERDDYGRSWLIDTTPGSLSGNADRTDGSLAIGKTFADTAANVYITPIARGGTSPDEYLDVKVNLGPFPGNGAPVATLNGPSTVSARQTCVFSAQASDPNGDELAYSWDFGQGFTFDNHPTAVFSWNSGGTYTVKVTVYDMKGQSTIATKTITVTDPITTWTSRTNSASGSFTALAASANKVLAVSHDYSNFHGSVTTSSDGVTWATNQLASNQYGYGATWDGSRFLLAGEAYDGANFVGSILTSTTGTGGWTTSINTGATLRSVVYGGGVYVAVGDGGTIRSSTNGTSWTLRASGTINDLNSVTYGGGKFVVGGYSPGTSGDPTILTSSDGINWTNASAGAGVASWQDLRSIIWANDRFLASGWYGKLRYSTDFGTSFSTTRTTNDDTPAMAYGNGVWFAAGVVDATLGTETDIDLVSTDGVNWTNLTTPSLDNRNAAIFFNNTFITVGENHSIRQSGAISSSANAFVVWRENLFPDHGPLSAPDEDSDGDGINNLLEYALGTSPVLVGGNNGVGALPQALLFSAPTVLNDRIAIQFNLPEPAAPDLRYVVEASSSLSNSWTPIATKIGTGAWTWNGGGTSRIVLGTASGGKIPVTVGDSQAASVAPARFLRLRTAVNQ